VTICGTFQRLNHGPCHVSEYFSCRAIVFDPISRTRTMPNFSNQNDAVILANSTYRGSESNSGKILAEDVEPVKIFEVNFEDETSTRTRVIFILE
jgi:hypothetical protein